ncbi:hypothetical protein DL93DRAFT_1782211 [Clavulina sp. PMI_390]|nr:hypothetical protein DL93DRAFT_1782211 [Clavulina sp. PMI_390]
MSSEMDNDTLDTPTPPIGKLFATILNYSDESIKSPQIKNYSEFEDYLWLSPNLEDVLYDHIPDDESISRICHLILKSHSSSSELEFQQPRAFDPDGIQHAELILQPLSKYESAPYFVIDAVKSTISTYGPTLELQYTNGALDQRAWASLISWGDIQEATHFFAKYDTPEARLVFRVICRELVQPIVSLWFEAVDIYKPTRFVASEFKNLPPFNPSRDVAPTIEEFDAIAHGMASVGRRSQSPIADSMYEILSSQAKDDDAKDKFVPFLLENKELCHLARRLPEQIVKRLVHAVEWYLTNHHTDHHTPSPGKLAERSQCIKLAQDVLNGARTLSDSLVIPRGEFLGKRVFSRKGSQAKVYGYRVGPEILAVRFPYGDEDESHWSPYSARALEYKVCSLSFLLIFFFSGLKGSGIVLLALQPPHPALG